MDNLLVKFPEDFKPVPSHKGLWKSEITTKPVYLPPGGFWRKSTRNISPNLVDKPKLGVVQ